MTILAWVDGVATEESEAVESDTAFMSCAADDGDGLHFEAIARRACEIWLRKGQPRGLYQRNWQQAEDELRSEQRAGR